jgi:hypothetical protein
VDPALIHYELIEALLLHIVTVQRQHGPAGLLKVGPAAALHSGPSAGGGGSCCACRHMTAQALIHIATAMGSCSVSCTRSVSLPPTQSCAAAPALPAGLAVRACWRAGGSSQGRGWRGAGCCAHLHAGRA